MYNTHSCLKKVHEFVFRKIQMNSLYTTETVYTAVYLARPIWHAEGLYILPMLLSFIFFSGPVGDQLSHDVLDRSSPNCQDRYIKWLK